MKITEFIDAVHDKRPPAPESQIRAFEQAIGHRLPDDYRDFLSRTNGGYVGGAFWFEGPTVTGETADAGIHHIGGFRKEHHFSLDSHRASYQGDDPRIPRELIWVMDDPFGNAICLGVAPGHSGHVYFWDHERETDPADSQRSLSRATNLQLLTHTFTAFIEGLVPVDEVG